MTLYEADTTTQSTFGFAQGFHVGAFREVRNESFSLTAGDSSVSLSLPTDLQGEYRYLQVRGALLQTRAFSEIPSTAQSLHNNAQRQISGRALLGWTGNGYQNAFFRSIEATKAVQLVELHIPIRPRIELFTIAVRGSQKSLLTSAAWAPTSSYSAAMTGGWSGGNPVMRAMLVGKGETWQGGFNFTAGTLHLQPEPSLTFFTLERTGFNGYISKRLGGWLTIDASRNQYDTAALVDAAQSGVTAKRSTFTEAGITARHGAAEAGLRLLQSTSGLQTHGGAVAIAGWNTSRWSLRATALQTVTQAHEVQRSALLSSTQTLSRHLKITESTTLANQAPTADFGGVYENRFGSITVSHREAFVPFGTDAGFHRLLSIGIRLHLGSTDIAADQISGRDLPTNYDFAASGYYGSSLGDEGMRKTPVGRLPRYEVQGLVKTTAGEPIRGAAVQAGKEVVYTDSEGSFTAQFTRATPVEVALAPGAFLSPISYRAVSAPMLVTPTPMGTSRPLLLTAQSCIGCVVPDSDLPQERTHDSTKKISLRSRAWSLLRAALQPGIQMLNLLPHRRSA